MQVPHIPMLKEKNIRKGFFEHDEYQGLINALPSYIKPIVGFAYRTGWRKSEILNLTWDRIDFKENIVRLEAGESKNSEGRTIYLDSALSDILLGQKKDSPFAVVPNAFPPRRRKDIMDFGRTGLTTCEKIGLLGRLFHDLRRHGRS